MSLRKIGLIVLVAVSVSGCFGAKDQPPPPQPLPPTRIELHVEAAQDVNPNAEGRGSPVLLRIYELKGLSGFNAADYFALSEKDQTALGADMVRKQEFMLRPNEKKTLLLQPEETTGFLAAFAGFRNLGSARWRVSVPIQHHVSNVYELKLAGSQMVLSAPPTSPTGRPQPAQTPKVRQ